MRTFFVPWKNENRKGFVAIARGIGMTVKLFVLLADLILLTFYYSFAITFEIIFILTPIIALALLGGLWIK